MDFGYPSIAYAGNGYSDNRLMITSSFLPAHGYPGTGAFYIDNSGNVSDMLHIIEGHSTVDMIPDSSERWGDYTTVQRVYNKPNTLWLNGSYTNPTHTYQTQIAEIYNTDNALLTGIGAIQPTAHQVLYPNPAKSTFTVEFDLESDTHCHFALIDEQGRIVRVLMDDEIDAGTERFSFSTAYLTAGTYYLHITSGDKTILSKPVVIGVE